MLWVRNMRLHLENHRAWRDQLVMTKDDLKDHRALGPCLESASNLPRKSERNAAWPTLLAVFSQMRPTYLEPSIANRAPYLLLTISPAVLYLVTTSSSEIVFSSTSDIIELLGNLSTLKSMHCKFDNRNRLQQHNTSIATPT